MLGLRGVPGRSNVTLNPLENHERLNPSRKIFPVRIGTRQVTFDETISTVVLENGWQMRGKETGRARRSENAQRSSTHQCVHLFQIVHAMMFGLVHVAILQAWSFDSNIRKRACRKGMRMLESNH